ncbi:MAG: TPM domain-containing protein [Phormidesmis sp.]
MTTTAIEFKLATDTFSLAAFPLPVLAVSVDSVPNPREEDGNWVTDMAEALSDPTEVKLNQLIADLEAQNGSEVAVVTVPNTLPADSTKEFATDLFNAWGIGKAEADNGVLFLIDIGERRVEIETGYGIEEILPDAKVAEIIEQEITPSLKQGDYDSGTLAGTQALVETLQQTPTPETQTGGFGFAQFGGLLVILTVVIGLLFGGRKRLRRAGGGRSTTSITGSSGSSGSSGGGSSGGGGAGGSY